MLCEAGLDEFAPQPPHAGVGAFLIKLHKAAVPRDFGREDCCNASHLSVGRGGIIVAAVYRLAAAYRIDWTARSIGVAHLQIPRTYPQRR
jgi:hypothetical protein